MIEKTGDKIGRIKVKGSLAALKKLSGNECLLPYYNTYAIIIYEVVSRIEMVLDTAFDINTAPDEQVFAYYE